jgi:hypothetical protein
VETAVMGEPDMYARKMKRGRKTRR